MVPVTTKGPKTKRTGLYTVDPDPSLAAKLGRSSPASYPGEHNFHLGSIVDLTLFVGGVSELALSV